MIQAITLVYNPKTNTKERKAKKFTNINAATKFIIKFVNGNDGEWGEIIDTNGKSLGQYSGYKSEHGGGYHYFKSKYT